MTKIIKLKKNNGYEIVKFEKDLNNKYQWDNLKKKFKTVIFDKVFSRVNV